MITVTEKDDYNIIVEHEPKRRVKLFRLLRFPNPLHVIQNRYWFNALINTV